MSKDIYEDQQNMCNIVLVDGDCTNPLASNCSENYVETAIEHTTKRLEGILLLTPIVNIRMEYLKKSEICSQRQMNTLWEVSVNIEDFVRKNKKIIESHGITAKH